MTCKECGGKRRTREYCALCYQRALYQVNKGASWDDPDLLKTIEYPISCKECGSKSKIKGYCGKCYCRAWRHARKGASWDDSTIAK